MSKKEEKPGILDVCKVYGGLDEVIQQSEEYLSSRHYSYRCDPDLPPKLNPSPYEIQDYFHSFVDQVRERLKTGAKTYGEKSFTRSVNDLLVELEEGALDLAGWSFVLWVKLRRLEKAAKEIDRSESSEDKGCDVDCDWHHQRPEEDP